MDFLIADIRIDLPDELLGGPFARALAPFTAPGPGIADLALTRTPAIGAAHEYRELDRFDFSDADADCRFGRDAAGYLLEMIPRSGAATASFRMRCGCPTVETDFAAHHDPALLRFGLWTAYNFIGLSRTTVAVHSSVVLHRGEAVLVLGESGTGKSTHTRLWRRHIPGAGLLNDDSPIVKVGRGGASPEVYGSPWSGKTPCYRNEHYPIRALLRLSQAPHNRIRRLRPLEAIGALLPSCPPAFAHDKRLLDDICTTMSGLLAQTPCYHLECLPDGDAARLACDTIYNGELR